MGVSVESSIYNASSIYETGAGGGGGGGSNGAGSVDMPEGYRRLMYIQNTDNGSYIPFHNVSFDKECEFEFIFESNVNNDSLYLYNDPDLTNLLDLEIYRYDGHNGCLRGHFFGVFFEGLNSGVDIATEISNFKISKNGIDFNGYTYAFSVPTSASNLTNLYFPSQPTNGSIFKAYAFKVKKGDSFIHDMLPVYDETLGKVGFFDLVNEIFYPGDNRFNPGSGWAAGPDFPY